MINRNILTHPTITILKFDHYNDFGDTYGWLGTAIANAETQIEMDRLHCIRGQLIDSNTVYNDRKRQGLNVDITLPIESLVVGQQFRLTGKLYKLVARRYAVADGEQQETYINPFTPVVVVTGE